MLSLTPSNCKKMKKFIIEEQDDGNYIGETTKDGKVIRVREADPATALLALITHDGNSQAA